MSTQSPCVSNNLAGYSTHTTNICLPNPIKRRHLKCRIIYLLWSYTTSSWKYLLTSDLLFPTLSADSEGPVIRSSYSTRNLAKFRNGTRKRRSTNNRSFRYNLRLKLVVSEGARNMFYDYAYTKADQVADLRRELFNESVEIVSASDSDYISESD